LKTTTEGPLSVKGSNPLPSAPTSVIAILTWANAILGGLLADAQSRSIGLTMYYWISPFGGQAGANLIVVSPDPFDANYRQPGYWRAFTPGTWCHRIARVGVR